MIEPVNENQNYQIEALVNEEWKYIMQEYSVSAAMSVAGNIYHQLSVNTRVVSLRSDKVVYQAVEP